MPRVTINDVEYEGQPGERLIDVARRNGAHIGFVCDGAGFCQTCTCTVLEGHEHLSAPTDAERNWFSDAWIEGGQRLACQATLQGPGPISIMSRAEELRRQLLSVFYVPKDTSAGGNLGSFLNHVGGIVANQIVRFPGNAARAIPMFKKAIPNQDRVRNVFQDADRVVQSMLGSTKKE